ncbi:MAG: hypothetical protein A2Y23_13825 [Clostridiales bacterium GWB2_37_7]|nr:MAG: hypothetical protein A2Y23_13825 [Clostridiales bacterium GWB2_37_7]
MVNFNQLAHFVAPFYENKDIMHNLSHIERMIDCAKVLITEHKIVVDEDIIIYGSYFHGFIYREELLIREFLLGENLAENYIEKIVLASWESQKDKDAMTQKGMVLHDAHLIEGGKTFLIVKSLVTGTARGQKLEQTIDYIENKVIGKSRCYFPKAQELYRQKEEYARVFMKELRAGLYGASTSV